MDDLLTTKQVQEYLQVDRTTIYRMLRDGRLVGIKVGQQWRFPHSNIEAILEGNLPKLKDEKPPVTPEILPIHCVQIIQDVFAEIAGVGAVTTTKEGEPLTSISNSCNYCNLILDSETGYRACKNTWKKLANLHPTKDNAFFTCHAGMQYSYSRINVDNRFAALLIVGQFHLDDPTPKQIAARIRKLAQKHGINPDKLKEAAKDIPTLDEHSQGKIGKWIQKVAVTFSEVSSERAELIGRLSSIAEMTKL